MKISTVLLALAALPAAAQSPFTYETPQHLFSALDADGDGRADLAVVDREAATLAVGFQLSAGNFTFSTAEPTGIPQPAGLAAGRFLSTAADTVALTSRSANRVSLFSLSSPSATPVVRHLHPSTPTPKWLAAASPDADALAELVVSAENGTGFRMVCMDALDAAPATLWSQPFGQETRRINPLRPRPADAPRLGNFFGNLFYMDEVLTTGLGASASLSGSNATADSRFATGFFGGSDLATLIIHEPGAATARTARLSLSGSVFSWGPVSTLTFPSPVRLLVTIPVTTTTSRLAALLMDGSAATWDFTGPGGSLTPRATITGPLDFIAPVGTDSLLAIRGNLWQRFNTANTGTLGISNFGNFPRPSAASRVSNVVYLTGEPFVNPDAMVAGSQRARDWTTVASGGPSSWSVTALQQLTGGLSIAGTSLPLTAPAAASHALVNQFRPDISVRSLEGSAGPALGDVDIQPPAGTYPPLPPGGRFTLTFAPSTPGEQVFYRLDGAGAWTLYQPDAPPFLTAAGSVEAYAQGESRRSPIRSSAWSFANAPLLTVGGLTDADDDGMSDQWEKAFALTDPNADADGDGLSNLAEFQSGSDPLIGSQAPPLVLTSASINGGATLRLEWPAAEAGIILEQSTNLTSWNPVTSGIVTAGAVKRYDVPVAPPALPAAWFRLRRP